MCKPHTPNIVRSSNDFHCKRPERLNHAADLCPSGPFKQPLSSGAAVAHAMERTEEVQRLQEHGCVVLCLGCPEGSGL